MYVRREYNVLDLKVDQNWILNPNSNRTLESPAKESETETETETERQQQQQPKYSRRERKVLPTMTESQASKFVLLFLFMSFLSHLRTRLLFGVSRDCPTAGRSLVCTPLKYNLCALVVSPVYYKTAQMKCEIDCFSATESPIPPALPDLLRCVERRNPLFISIIGVLNVLDGR